MKALNERISLQHTRRSHISYIVYMRTVVDKQTIEQLEGTTKKVVACANSQNSDFILASVYTVEEEEVEEILTVINLCIACVPLYCLCVSVSKTKRIFIFRHSIIIIINVGRFLAFG